MPDPVVSVIIPTFNTAQVSLRATIDSVLNQTFADFECIVVDDGSKLPFAGLDGLLDDPRMVYVRNEGNIGVAGSRNRGIDVAQGKYLAFLDAGDRWYPEKLELQTTLMMKRPDLGMVFCGARFDAYGIRTYDKMPRECKDWYKSLLISNPITGSSSAVMCNARVLMKVGGFYTFEDIPEDRDMWLKIARNHPIGFVDQVLTHIILEADSRSADPYKMTKTHGEFMRLHSQEMKSHGVYGRAMAHYHAMMSHKYFMHDNAFQGFKHAVISVLLRFKLFPVRRSIYYIISRMGGQPYMRAVAMDRRRPM